MEIEIVTAKKKLTKSLIAQMAEINLSELDSATVLGFVNNNPTIILLEIERFRYRIMYWSQSGLGGTNKTYRKLGKWTVEKYFNTEEDRDEYLSKLSEFKKEAVQIYI